MDHDEVTELFSIIGWALAITVAVVLFYVALKGLA